MVENLKRFIRDIPGFPKEGIIFKDITPLLKDAAAFKSAVDLIAKEFEKKKVEVVLSVEARGFVFGSAIAYKLGAGIVPIRKKGKLPYKTDSITYDLDYAKDTL